MKFCYIMRGIPGSGKSTVAKQLAGTTGIIHDSDSHFYDESGAYVFDPSRLPEVRQKKLEAFSKSVAAGVPIIVNDSCNVTREQWEPYAKMASEAGYIVALVVMPRPDMATAIKRNIHSVPESSIQKMMDDWED